MKNKEPIKVDANTKGLKAIKGLVLQERFKVGKMIDKGSHGSIFDCKDL